MNEELVNKVESAIKIIGEKLGVGADHFWPIVTQQQIIEGWIGVFAWFLAIILWFVLFTFFIKSLKRTDFKDAHNFHNDLAIGLGVSCGVTLLFIVIPAIAVGHKVITQIINPEYWALRDILRQLQ